MKAQAIVLAAVAAVGFWAFAACDDSSGVHETAPDAGSSSGGQETGAPQEGGSSSGNDGTLPQDCFTNPQNHFEIINACTDSQKFDKNPNLPLLLPDGGLPALL
jgi:hypothetical protein